MSYTGQNSCDNTKDTHIGLAITGYFMNTKSRDTKAILENSFKNVSDEQLKLKNY